MTNVDTGASAERPARRSRQETAPSPEADAAPSSTVSEITISGQQFRVPSPFAEGHVLTAGQASALNQVFHENIRNNFREKVKAGTATQADIDSYAGEYEFGVRKGGGGRTADPVRREALSLAKAAVENAIRKKGEKPSDYTAETIRAEAEKHVEKFMEKAQRIVAARQDGDVEVNLEA